MSFMPYYNKTHDINTYNRTTIGTKTCYGKEIDDVVEGFLGEFKDSYLFTFVIQFMIVGLMHYNVGRGRYWRLLFYSSIAGLCGAVIEHATVTYICRKSAINEPDSFNIMFLLNEVFWIINEYSIPYLNLIKMNAFSKGKKATYIKYSIYGLTVPFIFFRLLIGIERAKRGYLYDQNIGVFHGYAFLFMAMADLTCTFSILYFVRQQKKRMVIQTSNINHFVKHSSYTILITVDIISAILALLDFTINDSYTKDWIPEKYVLPFHCLKNAFVLILAADALIFKYSVNSSSANSSGNKHSYGGGNSSYSRYRSNNKSYLTGYGPESSNQNMKFNQSSVISISNPYNATSTTDNNYFSKVMENPSLNTKSIVKNYTHNSSFDNDSPGIYPQQNFGFLSHQQI